MKAQSTRHIYRKLWLVVLLPALLLVGMLGSLFWGLQNGLLRLGPWHLLVVLAVSALFLSALAAAYLLHDLIRPLRGLREVLDELPKTAPEAGAKIPVALYLRQDELGLLVDAVMRLQERIGKLQRSHQDTSLKLELADAERKAEKNSRNQLLADMGRELYAPLSAVVGYSEILQDELAPAHAENWLPYLDKIRAAGEHLLMLFNNLLYLSYIENDALEFQPQSFLLPNLVEEVIHLTQPLAQKSKNRLECSLPENIGWVISDEAKLRQILLNLLYNACKFAENDEIHLSVEQRPGDNGEEFLLRFRVYNACCKTAYEASAALPDNMGRDRHPCTNLGLTISRRFAVLLGGSLELECQADDRMRVEVSLPFTSPPETTVHAVKPEGESCTVLVIDDDPDTREVMRRHLEKMGHCSLTADTGEAGLRLARSASPHLIALDVKLPDMDGSMVLSILKSDAKLHAIPVVILCLAEERPPGHMGGAADYLMKPITRERLASIFARYLPQHGVVTGAAEYLLAPARERARNGTVPGVEDDSPLVMLVEDDPTTLQMMTAILRRTGWGIMSAENGREALEKLDAEQKPSLILLDLMMPEMDGFEFTARLRERPEFAHLPVVVLTAKDISSEDREFLNDKVQAILQKGAQSHHDLLEELREVLNVAYSSSFIH